jgi:hypothetical protein
MKIYLASRKADVLAIKAILYVLAAEMDREAIQCAATEVIRKYSRLPDEFNDKACEAVAEILL